MRPLPHFLEGRLTAPEYCKWLEARSWSLFYRDRMLNRPYAAQSSASHYEALIHDLVMNGAEYDPFTGDALRWELVNTWDNAEAEKMGIEYSRRFVLMPTIDHCDPAELKFEICSWLLNRCKNYLTALEFRNLCATIVSYRGAGGTLRSSAPQEDEAVLLRLGEAYLDVVRYPMPAFLEGKVAAPVYHKWLDKRADKLFAKDKRLGRPYALRATAAIYQGLIHRAVTQSGQLDPFTGEALRWELIGTWDTTPGADIPDMDERHYALLPTIDHADPKELAFEICSWVVNTCKSELTPEEFVALCKRVVEYRGRN